MKIKKPLPPTYFFGGIVLAAAIHFLFPLQQLLVFPWRLAGLLPLVIGIVLNLMADQALKTHNTTVKPLDISSTLITRGVFTISRNPMYLGMTLILLGIALLLGSATPLVVVIVLPVLFDLVFITPEEKMLEDAFGEEFRQYRKQVRRWI